ncbi:MAG: hypothetical protein CMM91_04420 [Rickettsiales bacterium]|nr:hypothetical protein [Rickettsiales bacterium]OUV53718.1 MAG: hypothetical protein CBC87_03165 [Rickettsiales bacterium TMED127]|tara:strand:+ start:18395 stop:18910 length:516 start_codon:yes stop_codon:yes gene_type:complete
MLNFKNLFFKINKILNNKINFLGFISSLLVPVLIIIISITVILRYFFSLGFIWMQDLYIWMHASIILLGTVFTLKEDGHVRIDLFYRNASKKFKIFVNIIGYLFFCLPLSLILILKGFPYFYRSFLQNEGSRESGGLPGIYILKFLIFLLGIFLFIQIINFLINVLQKKWR